MNLRSKRETESASSGHASDVRAPLYSHIFMTIFVVLILLIIIILILIIIILLKLMICISLPHGRLVIPTSRPAGGAAAPTGLVQKKSHSDVLLSRQSPLPLQTKTNRELLWIWF